MQAGSFVSLAAVEQHILNEAQQLLVDLLVRVRNAVLRIDDAHVHARLRMSRVPNEVVMDSMKQKQQTAAKGL